MSDSVQKRLLLTGAAGRIGTNFYEEMRDRYWFRLADRAESVLEMPAVEGHEALLLEIADLEAFQAAAQGIDVVVHLAADPSPEAPFYESLVDNNLKGTYNAFRSAVDAGCQRVIFASSIHAIIGHPTDRPIPEDATLRPINMYGVSKCFGEATTSSFATTDGLSAIAIRIGAYEAPWLKESPDPNLVSAFVSPRDLNQLIARCIDTPDIDYAVVHGSSQNSRMRMSLDKTRQLLGYEPVDDGFVILGIEP
jgi:nucleoside-diphosphate-sugar epimerase